VDYLIIDQDPDYAWVAVGHPSRDYFWILSRTRSLPETTVDGIMTRAVAQGYDRSRFAEVPQPAE
jgi:apolipoprotein D and lipocalin family protein